MLWSVLFANSEGKEHPLEVASWINSLITSVTISRTPGFWRSSDRLGVSKRTLAG
jgi:hypothetical protein